MLAADVNLQVWLDTQPDSHPSVVIPYVQSTEAGAIQYQLSAIKQGRGGYSAIRQSGSVRLQPNQPAALTRFSLSVGRQDQCKIELVLFANGNPAGAYQFDCPRTP